MNLAHDRINNFDAVRLFGAVLVLVGHAYPLHGLSDYPSMWGSPVAVLGILVFFSVSGYLISGSWDRDPRPLPYLRKRALRIFPGLAVAIILSVLVLGPIVSSLSVPQYFSETATWRYLANIGLYPIYSLPGVFETVPYSSTVNGSLWSLPIEFACYLMVPIVSLASMRFRSYIYGLLAIVFGIGAQLLIANDITILIYGSSLSQAAAVWPYFMVGAAIATSGIRVPIRLDAAMIALLATSLLDAVRPEIADYLWWFVLPYTIIAIGSARTAVIARAGRFGDLSYGIYLYAFPVQQVLMLVAPQLPMVVSIAATALLSALCALASWHLVEKQALKLKGGRRLQPTPSNKSEPREQTRDTVDGSTD